jgi:hypothetical protein
MRVGWEGSSRGGNQERELELELDDMHASTL